MSPAEIDATVAQVQVVALAGKARIDAAKGEITVLVPLDKEETEKLTSCVKSPEAKTKVQEAVALVRESEKAFGGSGKTRDPSPYEKQMDFIVPLLCVSESGMLFEFESTFLLEHPWKLSAKDAALSGGYNPLQRPTGKAGMIGRWHQRRSADQRFAGNSRLRFHHHLTPAGFCAWRFKRLDAGKSDWLAGPAD